MLIRKLLLYAYLENLVNAFPFVHLDVIYHYLELETQLFEGKKTKKGKCASTINSIMINLGPVLIL